MNNVIDFGKAKKKIRTDLNPDEIDDFLEMVKDECDTDASYVFVPKLNSYLREPCGILPLRHIDNKFNRL